jgi:hypothetical protein
MGSGVGGARTLVRGGGAGAAACLPLGAICARFRDIPPIVGSVLQIGFFVTPIIWLPSQLGADDHWLLLNPFFDLLEVVRKPLLGATAGVHVWPARTCGLPSLSARLLSLLAGCTWSFQAAWGADRQRSVPTGVGAAGRIRHHGLYC